MNSSLNVHMTRAFQTRTARGVSATPGLSERRRHPRMASRAFRREQVRSRHWKSRSVRTRARITMLSATSTAAPVVARAAPAAAPRAAPWDHNRREASARAAPSGGWPGARPRPRGGARASRRAPPRRAAPRSDARGATGCPVLRAAGEEPGEAPAGGDDAKASAGSDDAEAQFKTGLGSDPAFDAALASVSDMASDAAPRDPAEEKPRELTKEDFVAPSIDWGDTVVRNADASSDARRRPWRSRRRTSPATRPPRSPPPQDPPRASPSAPWRSPRRTGSRPRRRPAEPAPAMAPLSMSSSSEANQTEATGPVGLATLAPPPRASGGAGPLVPVPRRGGASGRREHDHLGAPGGAPRPRVGQRGRVHGGDPAVLLLRERFGHLPGGACGVRGRAVPAARPGRVLLHHRQGGGLLRAPARCARRALRGHRVRPARPDQG